jgi:3-hydroxybutyryl-CoA dehydrogenase
MQLEGVHKVAVIGVGQMGRGIAQVVAAAGFDVALSDIELERAEGARSLIEKQLDGLVQKGKMSSADAAGIVQRLTPQPIMQAACDAQIVIEAATENLELKLRLFAELDRVAPADSLLCSNTSSISITRLAAATARPALVAGVHFMNPVPVMKLVELIRGLITSDETHALLVAFAEKLGKTVVSSSDSPGFIVNRILIPMLNEACFTLSEGVASVTDIDQAIQLGLAHPMGPLRLADLIGLDTVLAIAQVLHQQFGDSKYRPAVLLQNLVAAGYLGIKSGRGFYFYAGNKPTRPAL